MSALILLFTVIAAGIFAWGKTQSDRVTQLRRRFQPVVDVEKYVEEVRAEIEIKKEGSFAEAENRIREAEREADSLIMDAEKQRRKKLLEVSELEHAYSQAKRELEIVENALILKSDEAHLLEVGYYEPVYGFNDIERYKYKLTELRQQQKQMLAIKANQVKYQGYAAYATQDLFFDGSKAEGDKLLARVLKLMLRAFNGECDSFIARVNYKNIDLMQRRIQSSFDQINKLVECWKCELSQGYLENRLAELELVYEYEELKQKEREEQARIRDQIREEEKAAREAAKAEEEANKEEVKYEELLRKAEQDAAAAGDKDKAKLSARIEELQQRIAEIEEKKRAISQAMLTKTGHVYIISNVGSFGDNIYKIGMTRRLEPMDRVKELGDASVPFPFDVHAMIRSSNAPALENALHNHFASRRLNLENQRKEFFRVTIDEIREELDILKTELNIDSELCLTLLAEAKEYRMSEAKRKHLEASWQAS
jgi:hypothetical protein